MRSPKKRTPAGRRVARERRTVEAMLHIYCRDLHGVGDGLCADCKDLAAYARVRLEKCPFGDDKPSCRECAIHCYSPDRRVAIQDVMRYAGPKMLLRHPWLALAHLWLEKRSAKREQSPIGRSTCPPAGEVANVPAEQPDC